jgi:hypothetical protein
MAMTEMEKETIRIHGAEGQWWVSNKARIEWCCRGRHGVIKRVPKKESNEVNRMLIYFFGSKCATWKNRPGEPSFMDVEFVHMTKVSPPPRKPWEWCGKTILFRDWQKQEEETKKAMARFSTGDKVYFSHKGQRCYGIVAGGRKRVTVIVDEPESMKGKWYIPPQDLYNR